MEAEPWSCATWRVLWLRLLHAAATEDDFEAKLETAFTSCSPLLNARAPLIVKELLRDPLRRLAMFGGREDRPLTLASREAAMIARFMGGNPTNGFDFVPAAEACRHHGLLRPMKRYFLRGKAAALSCDGSRLYVSADRDDCVDVYYMEKRGGVDDGRGSLSSRTLGGLGEIGGWDSDVDREALEFGEPGFIAVAPDDFVYVVEMAKKRVQILTPELKFHSIAGSMLGSLGGVCVDADVLVLAVRDAFDDGSSSVVVLCRHSLEVLRKFDFVVRRPFALSMSADGSRIAVADMFEREAVMLRVADGVEVARFTYPLEALTIALSPYDELLVMGFGYWRGGFLVHPDAGAMPLSPRSDFMLRLRDGGTRTLVAIQCGNRARGRLFVLDFES